MINRWLNRLGPEGYHRALAAAMLGILLWRVTRP